MKEVIKNLIILFTFKSAGNNPRNVEIFLSVLAWINLIILILTMYYIIFK